MSAPVLDRAEELIRTASTALRTLDALHLASALLVQSAGRRRLPFVTADGRQREAATVWLDVVWVD